MQRQSVQRLLPTLRGGLCRQPLGLPACAGHCLCCWCAPVVWARMGTPLHHPGAVTLGCLGLLPVALPWCGQLRGGSLVMQAEQQQG